MHVQLSEECFDVCIVGGGPAGLACLSAIREPYALDTLTSLQVQRALHSMRRQRDTPLSVCAVDPGNTWLQSSWQANFDTLRIRHLRSPALAHPDMFDKHALVVHAANSTRNTLKDFPVLLESGCDELKQLQGLGQTQAGLWKLPSTRLFGDFCSQLASQLPHTYLQGYVMDIDKMKDNDKEHGYQVLVKDHDEGGDSVAKVRRIAARYVILATGMSGQPVVPPGMLQCPRMFCWNHPQAFPDDTTRIGVSSTTSTNGPKKERVLVIGGGLTAVQVALRVVQDGHNAVLCSRRSLREKHFDLSMDWLDPRLSNQCLSQIYHESIGSRLEQLKEARDGGSVPPMYLKDVAKHRDRLVCWVGDVDYDVSSSAGASEQGHDGQNQGTVTVLHNGCHSVFDRVILACGVQPDCTANPLVDKLLKKWPIAVHGGYPAVTQDLQWDSNEHTGLFVVGAMAALEVGPDAGNLMGMRRAALVTANALFCRSWLRTEALRNPFEALWSSDSEDDDEDSDNQVDFEPIQDVIEIDLVVKERKLLADRDGEGSEGNDTSAESCSCCGDVDEFIPKGLGL